MRHATSWLGAVGLLAVSLCIPLSAPATPNGPPASAGVHRGSQLAMERGIAWLAQQQGSNGAWSAGRESSSAITALAVMAFLANGHTPTDGPYAKQVQAGINYVLKLQQPNGLFRANGNQSGMYDQGISTLMLCEAHGVAAPAQRTAIRTALALSLHAIMNAQSRQGRTVGGWRYNPEPSDADISVTGWQLMALRAAANQGAAIPPEVLTKAVGYIKRLSSPSGGFGYTGPTNLTTGRTAIGMLSLQLAGQADSREVAAGAEFLRRNPITFNQTEFFYYSSYYTAQAAAQGGGGLYTEVYGRIRDQILGQQNTQGYWTTKGGIEEVGGDQYATSLALLTLAVELKYLPIYQH